MMVMIYSKKLPVHKVSIILDYPFSPLKTIRTFIQIILCEFLYFSQSFLHYYSFKANQTTTGVTGKGYF